MASNMIKIFSSTGGSLIPRLPLATSVVKDRVVLGLPGPGWAPGVWRIIGGVVDRVSLGTFLRSRRERIAPSDVGLPATSRRRTPGLRREEAAQLAGVSVDYYARLEQGRGPQPSSGVVAALARAFRLTDDESDYLFHLAGHPPPPRTSGRTFLRPGMSHLLDRLGDSSATVLSDTGDVLARTPLAAAIFGDFTALPPRERNLFRRFFLGEPDAVRIPPADRDLAARAQVADLRATLARRPTDPVVRDLVDELVAGSPLFARLWADHDVAVRRSDRKRVMHPVVGMLELDCTALFTTEGDQRLVLHTATPGSETAGRLELLRVLGLQHAAPNDHINAS
jgi:transcriptional regulator with XRE-family HTH domain